MSFEEAATAAAVEIAMGDSLSGLLSGSWEEEEEEEKSIERGVSEMLSF